MSDPARNLGPKLALLALGNFAVGTGALVIAGVLPMIARDTGVEVGTAGQLVAVYALAYAVMAPLLGGLGAGVPRRWFLAGAMALLAVGSVLGGMATSFATLVAARVIAALGGAAFTPGSAAVAAAMSPPEKRGGAIALVFGGFSVATVLGVPLGTYLGAHASWRVAFVLVAVIGTIAAVGVAALLADAPPAARVGASTWAGLIKRPPLLRAVAAAVFQMAAQFTVFTYVAGILRGAGVGSDGVTLVLLGFGVSSVIGTQIGGKLADRFSPRLVVSGFLAGLALLLPLVSVFANDRGFLVVAIVVWGGVGFGFQAPQQKRVVLLAPEAPTLALALNASALYVGTSLGASAGGIASHGYGLATLGWIGAGLALVGLGLAARADPDFGTEVAVAS